MKFPTEGIPDDAKDWPASDMLNLGIKNVEWEEKHYPSGMRGAILLFEYTEERIDRGIGLEETGENPQFYFISGLDLCESILLLDKVKNRLQLELIRQEIKQDKQY